jgi:hypothetical protein
LWSPSIYQVFLYRTSSSLRLLCLDIKVLHFQPVSDLSLPPAFTTVSCSAYSIQKMEEIISSETSVDCQRTTRRYIPEESTLHNHRCEEFKSCISQIRLKEWIFFGTVFPGSNVCFPFIQCVKSTYYDKFCCLSLRSSADVSLEFLRGFRWNLILKFCTKTAGRNLTLACSSPT